MKLIKYFLIGLVIVGYTNLQSTEPAIWDDFPPESEKPELYRKSREETERCMEAYEVEELRRRLQQPAKHGNDKVVIPDHLKKYFKW